jgi:hypothetical protein
MQAVVLRGCAGGMRLLTRDGLTAHLTHSLRSLACEWPRTLHPLPVELSTRTPRPHPWLGAPGLRHAVAMQHPTHRRAARAGDIACSTHCRDLERLHWSSPGAGNACHRHAPGNIACRRFELPWGSPGAGSVCLLRAPHSVPCLFLPLSSAIPSPPGVRASNRSWLLSRSLAPA